MTGILNILAGALGVAKDTYFNLVSLLLPGNGTNGAQNNTFLDGSSNNFTITPNGNTTQGTFSPFSQTGWGNYFDGTGDTLTTAATTAYDFANNPFTIEAFVYTTSFATGQGIVSSQNNGSTNISGWVLTIETTGAIAFIDYSSGAGALVVQSSSGVILANKWHHVVVEKRGTGTNQFQIFVDGTAVATGTSNANIPSGTSNQPLTIANWRYATDPNREFTGYISNLRIVKSAVYNGTVVVPTAPFPTGTTNQVLLTCQSNRFIDSNTATTAQTLTVNGSPSVTPFSPFAPTSSYSAAAVGGSGYFDGTGDYLTGPTNTATAFNLTGDFTIEAWIYCTDIAASPTGGQGILSWADSSGWNGWQVYHINGSLKFEFLTGSTGAGAITSSTITNSQWVHIAVVRSGTSTDNIKFYVNGVSGGSVSYNSSQTSSSSFIKVGADRTGSNLLRGYISNARVVNGTAVYTGSFTPPTAPLTAITNTSLLLNFTNAGVVDATAKNVLETVGNAQISTTQSKWGGGSILFNGTTDYLKPPPSLFYAFGTGDFTIECWVRFSSTTVSNGQGICQIDTAYLNSTLSGPAIGTGDPSGKWGFFIGTTAYEATSLIPSTNTWYHVAMVRYSGTTKLYVDGTAVPGLSQADTNNYTKQYLTIGGWFGTGNLLDGYIDDFRVSRFARYTADFTAPTAPFPVQ